jgi:hypothetical protein
VDHPEPTSHSFVVKIWLEETGQEAGHAVWRGHITHVASGARRYVKDLAGIVDFIAPYLEQMGVRMGAGWRLRRWRRH